MAGELQYDSDLPAPIVGKLVEELELGRRDVFGKDTDRLFAFETICWTLGLSAQRIRAELVTFAAVKLCAGNPRTDRRCVT